MISAAKIYHQISIGSNHSLKYEYWTMKTTWWRMCDVCAVNHDVITSTFSSSEVDAVVRWGGDQSRRQWSRDPCQWLRWSRINTDYDNMTITWRHNHVATDDLIRQPMTSQSFRVRRPPQLFCKFTSISIYAKWTARFNLPSPTTLLRFPVATRRRNCFRLSPGVP